MRVELAVFAVVIVGLPSLLLANTNTVVFPPTNCSSSELRIIAWQNGAPSTYCISGQDVLQSALPNCADGQAIVYRSHGRTTVGTGGGGYVCETLVASPSTDLPATAPEAVTPPSCSEQQTLAFVNGGWACRELPQPVPSNPPAGGTEIVMLDTVVTAFVERIWKDTFPTMTDKASYIAFSRPVSRSGFVALNAPKGATHAIVQWHTDNNSAAGNFAQTLAMGDATNRLENVSIMDSGQQSGKPYQPVEEFNDSGESTIRIAPDGKLYYNCQLTPSMSSIAYAVCKAFVKGYIVKR